MTRLSGRLAGAALVALAPAPATASAATLRRSHREAVLQLGRAGALSGTGYSPTRHQTSVTRTATAAGHATSTATGRSPARSPAPALVQTRQRSARTTRPPPRRDRIAVSPLARPRGSSREHRAVILARHHAAAMSTYRALRLHLRPVAVRRTYLQGNVALRTDAHRQRCPAPAASLRRRSGCSRSAPRSRLVHAGLRQRLRYSTRSSVRTSRPGAGPRTRSPDGP